MIPSVSVLDTACSRYSVMSFRWRLYTHKPRRPLAMVHSPEPEKIQFCGSDKSFFSVLLLFCGRNKGMWCKKTVFSPRPQVCYYFQRHVTINLFLLCCHSGPECVVEEAPNSLWFSVGGTSVSRSVFLHTTGPPITLKRLCMWQRTSGVVSSVLTAAAASHAATGLVSILLPGGVQVLLSKDVRVILGPSANKRVNLHRLSKTSKCSRPASADDCRCSLIYTHIDLTVIHPWVQRQWLVWPLTPGKWHT